MACFCFAKTKKFTLDGEDSGPACESKVEDGLGALDMSQHPSLSASESNSIFAFLAEANTASQNRSLAYAPIKAGVSTPGDEPVSPGHLIAVGWGGGSGTQH